ncbi:MAG: hypothetical protein RR764_09935 [Oscillospiraceae bacterium]
MSCEILTYKLSLSVFMLQAAILISSDEDIVNIFIFDYTLSFFIDDIVEIYNFCQKVLCSPYDFYDITLQFEHLVENGYLSNGKITVIPV